jgi:hypothetical protein
MSINTYGLSQLESDNSTLFCLPAEQAGFSWHGNVQTFPFSHTVSNALCNLEKLHQKQSDAGCHRFIRRGLDAKDGDCLLQRSLFTRAFNQ